MTNFEKFKESLTPEIFMGLYLHRICDKCIAFKGCQDVIRHESCNGGFMHWANKEVVDETRQ